MRYKATDPSHVLLMLKKEAQKELAKPAHQTAASAQMLEFAKNAGMVSQF
jgi:hypothetical protein